MANGASFFDEIAEGARLLGTELEDALSELVARGRVRCDSYAGLRALLVPASRRSSTHAQQQRRRRAALFGIEDAGRWLLTRQPGLATTEETPRTHAPESIEQVARVLLRRYGVVCWSVLEREAAWLPPWRDLVRTYRRLEARGEIRGGRFVGGFGGEQYALPEAVGRLRAVRKLEKSGELSVVSGADPLNLVGILTPDTRVPGIAQNRILFRDGVAIAAWEGGEVRRLAASELDDETLHSLLSRRTSVKALKPYFRTPTERERQMLERKRQAHTVDETDSADVH